MILEIADFLTTTALTKQTGPDIGATAPVDYGFVQGLPGDPASVLYYIQGAAGSYGDWLSAAKLPLLHIPTNYLQLDFDLTVDQNAAKFAQALEFDTVYCSGGWNYLFGFQINYAQNGTLQISAADQSGWQASFAGPGKLAPDVAHHFTLGYTLNLAARTYQFQAIVIDGVNYPIPPESPLNGLNKNWSDLVILQVQQDTNAQAGRYSFKISNAKYTAS